MWGLDMIGDYEKNQKRYIEAFEQVFGKISEKTQSYIFYDNFEAIIKN